VFLRILIWSVVIFFLARFIWRIVAQFLGPSTPEQQTPKVSEPPPKPKEEFKDVRDAKFIDVPKTDSNQSGDNNRESEGSAP